MFSITPLCIQRVSRHSVLTVQHDCQNFIQIQIQIDHSKLHCNTVSNFVQCPVCAMPSSSAFSNIRPSASYKHNVYHVIIRSGFSFLHSACSQCISHHTVAVIMSCSQYLSSGTIHIFGLHLLQRCCGSDCRSDAYYCCIPVLRLVLCESIFLQTYTCTCFQSYFSSSAYTYCIYGNVSQGLLQSSE